MDKFIPAAVERIQQGVIPIVTVPRVHIHLVIPNRIQKDLVIIIMRAGHTVLHHQVHARERILLLLAIQEVLLAVRPVVQPERILHRVVRPARHEALRVVPLVLPEAVLLVHQVLLPDLPVVEEVVDNLHVLSIISMRS